MVSGTAQIPYKIAKAEHCSQIIQEGTVMEFIGGFIGGFIGAFIGVFNALKGVALMGLIFAFLDALYSMQFWQLA
jgi:hypothetical protein